MARKASKLDPAALLESLRADISSAERVAAAPPAAPALPVAPPALRPLASVTPIPDRLQAPPAVPSATIAAAPAQDPAALELAKLRAEVAALRAAAGKPEPVKRKGPRVEADPHGKGNVVLYYWHARHPVCLWPSQVDDLTTGVDLEALPADHVLRKIATAAAALPRRTDGGTP